MIHVSLETRISVYDMISAVGGTLGLFTGISVITVVEIIYWMARFLTKALFSKNDDQETRTTPVCWMDDEKDQSGKGENSGKVINKIPFGSEKGLITIVKNSPKA